MSLKETIHKIASYVISLFGQSKRIENQTAKDGIGNKKTYNFNEIKTANWKDTITYANGKKTLKHLGFTLTFPKFFIGRTDEVETIHDRLVNNKNILLLVNDQGGIGKTTLAAQYYYQYQDYYQHMIWSFEGMGIRSTLLKLELPLGVKIAQKMSEEEQLDAFIEAMRQLKAPCLLIINEVSELSDIQKYHSALLKCTNFHILLTTRAHTKIHSIETYSIKPLSDEEGIDLFKNHYADHRIKDNDLFLQLFRAVNGNTLIIKLLAKNLTDFNNELEQIYHLPDLLKDISDNILENSQSDRVGSFYDEKKGIQREETPEKIISAIYELSSLNIIQKRLLSILAILPPENIPYSRLKILMPQNRFDKDLLGLVKKGWLDFDNKEKSFRMNSVVQEVVRSKSEDLYKDCEAFISELIKVLDNQINKEYLKNRALEEAVILVRYGERIVENIKKLENNIALLCEKIGDFYKKRGNLRLALVFFEKYNELGKKLCESDPNNIDFKNELGGSYLKLSSTHSILGNLKLALNFLEELNQFLEKLYITDPNNINFKHGLAVSYEKLGETHSVLGNLKLALSFFEKNNEYRKEIFAVYPNDLDFKGHLAGSYRELGNIHFELDHPKLALTFFEKNNEYRKELYAIDRNDRNSKQHLAISYIKLGNAHSVLGNLKVALVFFEQLNQFFEELYNSDPNDEDFKHGLAVSYGRLGETHSDLEDLKLGEDLLKKYYKLTKELHDSYPDNADFRNDLGIACMKLGLFYSGKSSYKAKEYYNFSRQLLLGLTPDFHLYAKVQINLKWLEDTLG